MYAFSEQSLVLSAVVLIGLGFLAGIFTGIAFRGWKLEIAEKELAEYKAKNQNLLDMHFGETNKHPNKIKIEVKDGYMTVQKEDFCTIKYDVRSYNGDPEGLRQVIVENLDDYLFFTRDDHKTEKKGASEL